MTEPSTSSLASSLQRILVTTTPDDLWRVQAELLAAGSDAAGKAREVAGEFYSFLRDLESKVSSRGASRLAAVLETASVSSVGLQDMLGEKEDPLKRLLAVGVTAMLEVGAALKNVQAWETEASLVYYDVAWYLYGELWGMTLAGRPELSDEERRSLLDTLLGPVLDPEIDASVKAAVLVRFFQIALAARMLPLLRGADAPDAAE